MKVRKLLTAILIFAGTTLYAQEKPTQWDLSSCIDYALKNNIQIQKAKITQETSAVNTLQAKAQLLPSLSASISQTAGYKPVGSIGTYTGSYGISSSMTVFDGGKTLKNIEEQKLQEEVSKYSIIESEKSIQMSILQSYAQILYADEAVKVYDETVKASEYQYERGQQMYKAGSISQSDLAQLESDLSSNKYQLVVAQNTLSTAKLSLKQLLELEPADEINLVIPQLTNVNVLQPLASLQTIYETALTAMPQVNSSKVSLQMYQLETAKAKAGYLPTVSLNGSASTSHSSALADNIGTQINNNLYAGVGLTVSIPIFTNRENKSTLEKARLNEKTAQLDITDAQKSLLKEIETVYQDATSAQSQYASAAEKVKALETSYDLIQQQYNLGMKNTLELLTEKNNLLSAKQSLMQAKYLSIMDIQILNLYQDIPVNIK